MTEGHYPYTLDAEDHALILAGLEQIDEPADDDTAQRIGRLILDMKDQTLTMGAKAVTLTADQATLIQSALRSYADAAEWAATSEIEDTYTPTPAAQVLARRLRADAATATDLAELLDGSTITLTERTTP